MSVITKLEAQKKNKQRLSVYVDGKFFCGITLDEAVKQRLAAGREISRKELGELTAASSETDIYNKTLNYIMSSPRTEKQIRQYLFTKKTSPDIASRITERLKSMNFINDEHYAELFAESKYKKLSKREIKARLLGKGISAELAGKALLKFESGTQDELAVAVAEKYMRSKENDAKNLQKLNRYLIAKGFEYDIIGEIMQTMKRRAD